MTFLGISSIFGVQSLIWSMTLTFNSYKVKYKCSIPNDIPDLLPICIWGFIQTIYMNKHSTKSWKKNKNYNNKLQKLLQHNDMLLLRVKQLKKFKVGFSVNCLRTMICYYWKWHMPVCLYWCASYFASYIN